MTRPIPLTTARRAALRTFGYRHLAAGIDRTAGAEHLTVLVAGANAAIRAAYPEEDMAVLRRYQLARTDRRLRFRLPDGREADFTFPADANLADLPEGRGFYQGGEPLPVPVAVERAFDEYARLTAEADRRQEEQELAFDAALAACRTVGEVAGLIPLSADVLERLGHASAAPTAVPGWNEKPADR